MCSSGCFYENSWGGCTGRPKGRITVKPHCFEDEDVEAYNESVDDDAILAYALVGDATHIVTYDPHLAVVGGAYQGIALLDGLHFLYVVRGDRRI